MTAMMMTTRIQDQSLFTSTHILYTSIYIYRNTCMPAPSGIRGFSRRSISCAASEEPQTAARLLFAGRGFGSYASLRSCCLKAALCGVVVPAAFLASSAASRALTGAFLSRRGLVTSGITLLFKLNS